MSDLHTRKVLSEIGLSERMNWVETKTGFYSGGKLYSMSNIIEFFKFPPINLIDKFRLGLTIFTASKINNWKRLEQIPVETWLTRWSGKRVFDKIWLPLLKAKLGDNYKDTSAAFIWATIQRMYAARKSGLKKEMFGYVDGGYETINKAFRDHHENSGVRFLLETEVISVEHDGSSLRLTTSQGNSFSFDGVISTLSSRLSARLATGMEDEEKESHERIKYLGVICPSVLLSKPISPFYVTNITDKGLPFTGIIEMSALIDKQKELGSANLVYLPKYVEPQDDLFNRSDDEISQEFLHALFNMYPNLSKEDVINARVARARIVFALPTLNYSSRLPGIHTSIPGFYIVNSAQIINGTLNVNETIQVAESKLKLILNEKI